MKIEIIKKYRLRAKTFILQRLEVFFALIGLHF